MCQNRMIGKLLIAISLFAFSNRGRTADEIDSVELRYQFQPGQVVRYQVSDESTVEVQQNESEQTVRHRTKAWKHFTVEKVEQGRATLILQIDRVHMWAELDGEVFEFDSSLPGAAPAEFAHIPGTIGIPVAKIEISPQGKLLKAESLLANQKNKEQINERNLNFLPRLPDEAVKPGSQWKDIFEVQVFDEENRIWRKIQMQRRYKLASLEDNIATIDVETVVLTPVDDPEQKAQLIQRTPQGVILFDCEKGIILSRKTTLHNQVIGAQGPASSLKVVRSSLEKVIEGEEKAILQTAEKNSGKGSTR